MGAVAAVRVLHRRRLAEVPEDLRPQVELEFAAAIASAPRHRGSRGNIPQ
jgi:hypothetical protein